MRNIAYKTTRQWNPGDEFILLGVRRLLNQVFGYHNAIIYNCNPDVRPMEGLKGARVWKLPINYTSNHELSVADCYYRIGFMDNSIKFDSNLSYVDCAVFAGTPEILSHRVTNFYEHIIKFSLPCLVLGTGYWEMPDENQCNVLKRAKILTFRSRNLARNAVKDGFSAHYLPCPSICSSPIEKTIQKVKTIGLVFSVGWRQTVPFAGVSEKCAEYVKILYPYLISKLGQEYQIKVICHYIDELQLAQELFSPLGVPVYYSYEAKDYFDIYAECDIVLSTRVHGCGISSSLGIPNINIAHDHRSDTCEGFLSKSITSDTSKDLVFSVIKQNIKNIAEENRLLKEHKASVFNSYIKELQKINLKQVKYAPFKDNYIFNSKIERHIKKYL